MTTNEFERDVNDTAFLKRPGRVDLRILQNTPDCGDGHPGLQRCFRNYLHEGGMEKDLQLIGHGIKGTSVDINNAELQQLSNIGGSVITVNIWSQLDNIEATTITGAQWVFVGEADQALKQADSPTFGGLSLTGNLVLAANSITGTSVNINNAEMQQLSNIGTNTISETQWGYLGVLNQNLRQADSPTFVNLNLADDIIHVGDTDNLISFGSDTQDFQTGGSSRMDISDSGVRFGGANVRITGIIDNDNLGTSDVVLCTQGNTKAYMDAHAGADGSSHTFINQSVKTDVSPTFVGLTLSADLVTSSTIDGVDVSDFKTEFEAFNAIGAGNAQYIGLVYEHSWNYGQDFNLQQVMFANKGGTGAEIINFTIPLACDKGSYSLKLDDIILWLTDADGTNKIEGLTIYGIQNDSTQDMLYDEEADRTSPGTYIYDISNFDCAGYWKIVVMVRTTSASTDRIEFAAPILKYFYS